MKESINIRYQYFLISIVMWKQVAAIALRKSLVILLVNKKLAERFRLSSLLFKYYLKSWP